MITIEMSAERFAKEYQILGFSKRIVQELFLQNVFRDSGEDYAFCAQTGAELPAVKDNEKIIENMIINSMLKLSKSRDKALRVYKEYIKYLNQALDENIEIDWKRVMSVTNREALDERFEKCLAFALELDKLKNIGRQTYLADGKRKENDAEHSWHIAVMAYMFKDYANEPVNIEKVMLMLMLHDVVEIDAGDTYAYDSEGYKTKEAREKKAADRLFGILSEEDGRYFKGLWEEFEECVTPEAKYANALDRFQPMMLNGANKGKSWRGHDVDYERISKRFLSVKEGSERLYEKGKSIIEANKKFLEND